MKNNKILFAIFIFALPLVSCALQNNTSNDIINDTTSSSEIVYDETQSLYNLSFEVISEAEKTCGVKGCKEFYSDMRDSQIIIPREINGYKVTEVLDSAFEYCDFVKEVIMFERMKIIGDYAFNCCISLTSITIPNSVTSIGEWAFHSTSLTSITIPNGVTSIDDYACYYCTSLTSVNIPDSVTSIGQSAFSGCISLTSINIPNSVTSIGDYAFYGCNSLTIYCAAESKPAGWSDDWKSSDTPVVWGYNSKP